MARLFDDAQSEYLQVESPVFTSYPIAMACKFRSNDDAVAQSLIWCGDKNTTSEFCALTIRGDMAGDYVNALAHRYGAPASGVAITSTGYTTNVWGHAAGMWLSVSERHAYFNGGNKGSNTTTVGAMVGHDKTTVGANKDSSPGAYMTGDIAEVGIWDLTDWGSNDAERETNFEKVIASLAKDFSPLFYPLGLKAYWPLIRGLNYKVGSYNLTANGSVVSAHPQIIVPCGGL